MLDMAQQPKTWLQKPWILCSGLWTMFLIWQKPQPFSISEHMKPLLINVNCGLGILQSLDSAHLFVWFDDPLQSVNLLLHREVWSYPLVHLIPSQFIDCLELLLNVIFVLTDCPDVRAAIWGNCTEFLFNLTAMPSKHSHNCLDFVSISRNHTAPHFAFKLLPEALKHSSTTTELLGEMCNLATWILFWQSVHLDWDWTNTQSEQHGKFYSQSSTAFLKAGSITVIFVTILGKLVKSAISWSKLPHLTLFCPFVHIDICRFLPSQNG